MDNFNNANGLPSQFPSPSQASNTPQQNAPQPKSSNSLATTSLVMGICALVFICCGGGLILGALGIIFALLSRGSDTMNTQAKVGLGLSIGASALSLIILIIYIPAMVYSYGFQEQFNYEFERRYRQYYDDAEDNYDDYWDDNALEDFIFDNGRGDS